MRTAEAIRRFRKRNMLAQKELAEALDVTVASVSRYENGSEPTPRILRRLEELASTVRDGELKLLFGAAWRAVVVARVETLPSRGSARRVPVAVLSSWAEKLERGEVSAVMGELELFINR